MPNNPFDLAFWVARNLLLSNLMKQQFLDIPTTAERLKVLLEYIQGYSDICCAKCKNTIASTNSIFTMSKNGPVNSFVNKGGFVHDTITVTKANNIIYIGKPSTMDSWFEGYSWTIIVCHCSTHIGWFYHSSKKSPNSFYGVVRANLIRNKKE